MTARDEARGSVTCSRSAFAALAPILAIGGVAACGGGGAAHVDPATASGPGVTMLVPATPRYMPTVVACVRRTAARTGELVYWVRPQARIADPPLDEPAASTGGFVLETESSEVTFAFSADRRHALRLERLVEAAVRRQTTEMGMSGVNIGDWVHSIENVTYWGVAFAGGDVFDPCFR
jgi:hypothetical protein